MNRRPRTNRPDPLRREKLQIEWAVAQTTATSVIANKVALQGSVLQELVKKHDALCDRLSSEREQLGKRLSDYLESELAKADEIAQRLERQEQYLEEVRQHLGLGQTSTSAPKVGGACP